MDGVVLVADVDRNGTAESRLNCLAGASLSGSLLGLGSRGGRNLLARKQTPAAVGPVSVLKAGACLKLNCCCL